jgi:hypothetical protein
MWKEHYLEGHPGHDEDEAIPKMPIAFRNDKTRKAFQEESDEVKAEIEGLRRKSKDSKGEAAGKAVTEDLSEEEKRISELEGYRT